MAESQIPTSKKSIHYEQLKQAGQEAARWLSSPLYQAKNEGARECTVSVKDLEDLIRFVTAQAAKDDIEFTGKKIGYARESDIRRIIGGELNGMCVRRKSGPRFNTEVYFRELTPYVKAES